MREIKDCYIQTNFPIEKYHDEIVREFNNLKTFKKFTVHKNTVWPYHGMYNVARLEDVKKAYTLKFIEQEFYQMYGIKSKGRYLELSEGYELPPHIDTTTKCAFNYVIEGDSPIIFDDDNHILDYKKGLINVSLRHSVPLSKISRKLLKLSISDHTFEEVKDAITRN